MRRVGEYIRAYIDEDRLQWLIWFALISSGIAFIEWSISPAIAPLWLPSIRISDGAYFNILFGLAAAWICVVGAGIKKCGWPALSLLASAKWGLFPFYLIGVMSWACSVRGACP
jgi:hypothetical protein